MNGAPGPAGAAAPVPRHRGLLRLPTGIAYLFAIAITLVAFAVRMLADPVLPPGFPYLTFFPAVLLSALMAGTRPGMVSALLSFLLAWYYFIPPFRFGWERGTGVAMSAFAVVISVSVLVIDRLGKALDRSQALAAERDAAANLLADSEARFRTITEAMPQMVWSALPDGTTDYFNAGWFAFIGSDAHGADAAPVFSDALIHPDDRAGVAARWRQSLGAGTVFEMEYRLRHKVDEYRWVLCRAVPLTGTGGEVTRWMGTCTDIEEIVRARELQGRLNAELERRVERAIAEREAAEEALRQSQKMEAVGQLTGGIAHDFNNLLTVISGNIDLARRALASGAPGAERAARLLANAEEGAARAAALTQRLLAFSRRQPLNPVPTGLGELIEGVMPLLIRALGPNVAVHLDVDPQLWPVLVDRNQLENSLLNLAVNARDAMAGDGDSPEGEFTIRASNRTAGVGGVLPAADYVVLEVADTGCGMDAATAARVFEPFFTTKGQGKGTGLGLSMVYGFVRQTGGHMTVDSAPGAGTTFSLWLPRSAQPAVPRAARADAPAPTPFGGTVLVVEDDPAVRAYSRALLADLGFSVIEASDAASALVLLDARGGAVDLLFTDLIMPGMNGRALAETARARWPELKVLFTTGYAREAAPEDSGAVTVSKPFNATMLATQIEAVLAG